MEREYDARERAHKCRKKAENLTHLIQIIGTIDIGYFGVNKREKQGRNKNKNNSNKRHRSQVDVTSNSSSRSSSIISNIIGHGGGDDIKDNTNNEFIASIYNGSID